MSGGKYIPPSRRPGYVPSDSSIPPGPTSFRRLPKSDGKTTEIISLSEQFTHPSSSTFTFFSRRRPIWLQHQRLPYDPIRSAADTPLPPSPPLPRASHPLRHLVSYVRMTPGSQPAWKDDHEVWFHTNAELLIADWEGKKKNFGRPIPVFRSKGETGERYGFDGWWFLVTLEVVEPGSEVLRRMLQAKEEAKNFGRRGRTAEAWQISLDQQWVKVRLCRAPPTSPFYTELKDPMSLRGGEGGEVEKYLLEIGGLKEEQLLLS